MEKFKKFEINNQKSITGGKLIHTIYPLPFPLGVGNDLYDKERDRFIVILGPQ